jgi:membrane AbrB-like protein
MRSVWWWAALAIAAALLGWGGQVLEVPGGWFVGPLLASVTFALLSPRPAKVARPVLMTAQTVIGTMIGGAIHVESLAGLTPYLPEVAGVLAVTLAVAVAAGLLLARTGAMGRETAVLGTLPGGASAMTLLSIEAGADARVVALMQYLRVFLVVLCSSLVAHLLSHAVPGAHVATLPAPSVPPTWVDYAGTVVIAAAGAFGGMASRLPTATFLGPMLLAVMASAFHLVHPVWPVGVPQTAYVILGMYVGLLFDRGSVIASIKLLPLLIASGLALIVLCGLAGWGFAALIGVQALTGYLATSPGGADTIAIIALGSGADFGIVFSVQILRFLVILLVGPPLARLILKLSKKPNIETTGGTHEQ